MATWTNITEPGGRRLAIMVRSTVMIVNGGHTPESHRTFNHNDVYIVGFVSIRTTARVYAAIRKPIDHSSEAVGAVTSMGTTSVLSTYVDGNSLYINRSDSQYIAYDINTNSWGSSQSGSYTSGTLITGNSASGGGLTYSMASQQNAVNNQHVPLLYIS